MRRTLAIVASLLACAFAAPAGAATIPVSTTGNVTNSLDGQCSLVEAVTAADTNAASGPVAGECPAGESARDTIALGAGSYAVTAELTINGAHGPVTISGAGAGSTTITQQSALRVVKLAGAGDHVIQDVTLTGGHPGVSYDASLVQIGDGGAILNNSVLTLDRCILTANHAADGSLTTIWSNRGANGGAIANYGTLTIHDSQLTGNRAGNGLPGAPHTGANGVTPGGQPGADGTGAIGENGADGGQGGAIANSGSIVIERSLLDGNYAGDGGAAGDGTGGDGGNGSAVGSHGGNGANGLGGNGGFGGSGGAIWDKSGVATITDSTISNNTAGDGGAGGHGFGGHGGRGADGGIGHGGAGGLGGIGSGGAPAVGGNGGGVAFDVSVTTTDALPTFTGSLFNGNSSGHGGKGGDATGGAGGNAGNGALDGAGGNGGAATAVVGREGGAGGALAGAGASGGPYVPTTARPQLFNDTITANAAGAGGAGGHATGGAAGTGTAGGSNGSTGAATNRSGGHGGHGGAVSFAALTAEHLTVTANVAGAGGASGGSGAVAGAAGSGGALYTSDDWDSVYNSIVQANTLTNCSQTLNTYTIDSDGTCGGSGSATLSPLADNGGPTRTQAMAPGSFGFDDAAVDIFCQSFDQRGIQRPHGAACDFGAYEVAPPFPLTGAASAIAATEATVAATVNPNYRETSYHFEYGTTDSYGSSTPPQSAGSGKTATPASAGLTGLAPSTTYHYKVVASSPDGSTSGMDATFTTSIAPSTGGDGGGGTPGGAGGTGGDGSGASSGPGTNGPGTSAADTIAPTLSGFAIKPTKLKKKGSFRFKLSERARVVITIKRKGAKPVRITFQGVAGLNSRTLKRGRLKRGKYTATLVATDSSGNKSVAKKISFQVV